MMRIALAGNPNCGKTTLFNSLTGMKQHVGNWPGKTVERKEGTFKYKNKTITVIDLPGTYSLTAYSIEEIVARDFILDEQPDVVINIVDSANLERNLYLTVQLMELGVPVILALNMNRLARRRGIEIDPDNLSSSLGIPVVAIEAIDNTGKDELLDRIITHQKTDSLPTFSYGKAIDSQIDELSRVIESTIDVVNPRWTALKLLENDTAAIERVSSHRNGDHVLADATQRLDSLSKKTDEGVDAQIADARYRYIGTIIKTAVRQEQRKSKSRTERIDSIVTNKYLGIPIFLLAMYILFQITFTVSGPFVDWIDTGISMLAEWTNGWLVSSGAPAWVGSLIADGVLGGVGSVLVFVPIIMIMFFMISIFEDSGYMARAAFIMDKVMNKIGLHGKAFIPFLLGFGCTVPSIMATRTLENRRDRIMTMLLSPMMSCGARLPVYILFTAAFFETNQALIIFSLYTLGIVVAILMGLLFKKTLFKGEPSPFIMELPPYRPPRLTASLLHMWDRGKIFIKKAGTVIFGSVLVIWFLSSLPLGVEYGSQESVIGQIGMFIAPVFSPLGFGEWQTAVSLFFGIVAKEVVVGSMGALYGVGEEGLAQALQETFTPLSAYAFMVFVLLYVPCLVVLATIRSETRTWRWPIFTAFYLTAVAWIVSFIVYQGGLLLGFT